MAKFYRYRCPACDGEFNYLQHPSTAPVSPRFCPMCGHDTEADESAQLARTITAPHIQKSIVKAVDRTYAQMEGQAQERMEMAAEMTGGDAADFADMKMTDLKDNLREGDIAAVAPPPSEVSKLMEMAPQTFGFQQAPAAQGYAAAAHTGADAYIGARSANTVNQFHRQNHRAMNRAAETGRYNKAAK